MLQAIIERIRPVDGTIYDACIRVFDNVAKPIGGLGKLEELIARIGAMTGSTTIDIGKKCVLVFCADNGVVSQGVTQCDSTVTTAIARMMASKTSSVCVMAAAVGADVIPIDIGMLDSVPGLLVHKLMAGTCDISQGPAMTRSCAEKAIMLGIGFVEKQKSAGYRLIATGEAGIGNTTTAAAMTCALIGATANEAAGRGAGLSDEGLLRKQTVITQALEINRPDANDPIDVLTKVGGLDIAAMTGVFLGGALHRIPIVMDGAISAVAALAAVRLCPFAREYMLPSHISAEPASRILMEALGFSPILNADMKLGEGTGAVALFPLLDMAAAVYGRSATFEDISVEAYSRNL